VRGFPPPSSLSSAAYTMAKYGMSMCVLGMAEELKSDGIAVNALWPRTGEEHLVHTHIGPFPVQFEKSRSLGTRLVCIMVCIIVCLT